MWYDVVLHVRGVVLSVCGEVVRCCMYAVYCGVVLHGQCM